MAINIFQGTSKKSSNSKVNSASNSTRAQATRAALGAPAETSASGSTAVKTSGSLKKVGETVGKVAGIAAKFLPGVGGVVAKGLANILNDPEWWMSVPGDAVTLNVPLTPSKEGSLEYMVAGSTVGSGDMYTERFVFSEMVSLQGAGSGLETDPTVMVVTEQMVTQYLMPQIRKVVNAVPLQDASAYAEVLEANATAYAIWRNLLKFDYLLKHGQTYIPNLNVSTFPVFQVENAAWLQSTINRVEEYLRASVRLPHTLCEYLAWRFGRLYKTSDSAKAAIQLYDILPITASISQWDERIAWAMEVVSQNPENQKANTDMYNTYYDHDMQVVIPDHTQFVFDRKEFALRTNCDLLGKSPHWNGKVTEDLNSVYLDSSLDNPTAFMASTVSTRAQVDHSVILQKDKLPLFPVSHAVVYGKAPNGLKTTGLFMPMDNDGMIPSYTPGFYYDDNGWCAFAIFSQTAYLHSSDPSYTQLVRVMLTCSVCKSVELYNKDMFVYMSEADTGDGGFFMDFTTPSYDAAVVTEAVLLNEQVFAFANLVHITRKVSETYQKAEKEVAKETASLVENLDVAAMAPTGHA